MILSKFIDKTFKAAKKSALQIYGDDYSKLMDMMPEEKESDKNSTPDQQKKQQRRTTNNTHPKDQKTNPGVVFERSTTAKPNNNHSSDKKLEKKLESIRKYAAQQAEDTPKSFDKADASTDAEPPVRVDQKNAVSEDEPINNIYSRKDIRKRKAFTDHSDSKQELDTVTLNNMAPPSDDELEPLYDKFVEELPNGVTPVAKEQKETAEDSADDLHKRLDRLESLIHLALSTPDTTYSDHPLFHKLLHKGVSQKLIRSWFEGVIEQGILPAQQPEIFYSKLLQHINELLKQSKAARPKKIMLFTGRSGSGKTHLIMKLASQSFFGPNKKLAIASFTPANGSTKHRYSILAPFCDDHGIDFYHIQSIKQAKIFTQKWGSYDHVLIDTPSLEMDGQSLIEDIVLLKKELNNHSSIETHYLVNTAISGTAFNDPLAKDIEADHLALTHIDQSLKWGKTVQLLANTDYKLRYISSGPSITRDLLPFKPDKFARKLLRA